MCFRVSNAESCHVNQILIWILLKAVAELGILDYSRLKS